MGNQWGQGKGDGENKRGGGQYASNLGPEWMGIAPQTKEGFQVSKRGSGRGEGISKQKGVSRGLSRGLCMHLQ
jgi:hypothetical protein